MDLNVPNKVSYAHLLSALSKRVEEGHEPEDSEYFNELASSLYQGYCQDVIDLDAARRARQFNATRRVRKQPVTPVINLHFHFQ